MKMQLFGKTALVTGASSGIGRALAKALAKKGVVLAVSGRRKQALDTLADEIEKDGAKRPVVLTADLSKRGEARQLGERAA
ncbi:MAG: SDR family NAD(P)-dependent oxidoreductase, partial [Polyangia bacterium]